MASGTPPDQASDDLTAYYRSLLTGNEPDEIRRRRLYGRLPSSPRCMICYAPFKGPGGVLMRWRGRGPYPKNPRLCEACFRNSPPGGCEVEIGALFVDVRGSTALAERLGATGFARVINRYYATVMDAMLNSEAFIEITGDEVFGLYLPAFTRGNYARLAIETAERILQSVELNVGAGVHVGPAWVGTVGDPEKVKDFRAIGDTVNVGAGLVARATTGECLISETAYRQAEVEGVSLEKRLVALKGKAEPLQVRVIRVVPDQGNRARGEYRL
jgi:adenylate cyclase